MDFPDHETWRFINTFAPWLSAAGTVAAVITSLYFSRKDKRIQLQISADYESIIQSGSTSYSSTDTSGLNGLVIYVKNIGHRDAVIDGIFWKSGIFSKNCALQTTMENDFTSRLPTRIKDGEFANYVFPTNRDYDWAESNGIKLVSKFPWLESFFVKVQIRTSIGKIFEANIGPELRKRIVEAAGRRDKYI